MSTFGAQNLVTLLFADVQKSTRNHELYGEPFSDATAKMHKLARSLAEQHGGAYIKQLGDGFMLDFSAPISAALCASAIQSELLGPDWPADLPRLSLRIGIHTDEDRKKDGEYVWPISWRASRIMSAANGGQILLSEAVYVLIKRILGDYPSLSCKALGRYRLKDLMDAESLFLLTVEGVALSNLAPCALPEGLHNFPVEERPFIGREQNIEEIIGLFRERNAQLVTITGIGGIGKTRLAKQIAAAMFEDFPDGVWLIELDALTEREEIKAALCKSLSLDTSHESHQEALSHAFATRKMLLILDCFERIVEHADLIEGFLRFAPHVRCLVTSRVVLRLPREFEYELAPMQVGDSPSPRRPVSDSMTLFVEAASHTQPDFAITSKNRKTIHDICSALEGLPLAIILAASQLRYLSLNDLLEEIKRSRLEILSLPSSFGERHNALKRVVADSFRLLDKSAQRLLCELSVFSGGFHLEDARNVCTQQTALPIFQAISGLRDNSLIKAERHGEHTRYSLLDTVREYLEAIASDPTLELDLSACRQRHAENYARYAHHVHSLIQQGQWKAGNDSLWKEINNLRAAVRYGIASHQDELVIAFAESLSRTYYEAGLWSDFEALALAAEQAARNCDRADIIAAQLGLRGSYAARSGNREEARRLWEERVVLSLQIEDVSGAASTLFDLANLACEIKAHAEAQNYLARAINLIEGEGYPHLLSAAHAILSEIAISDNDVTQAKNSADLAGQLLEGTENLDAIIFVCIKLGRVYRQIGLPEIAERHLYQAIQTAMDGSRSFALSLALMVLGELYEQQQELTNAAYAFVAATRVLDHTASRRKQQAIENLERFCQNHNAEIQNRLNDLAGLKGEEIILRLQSERQPQVSE